MNPLTICLTNWRRPESLRRVLDGVLSQNIKSDIFLWNNNREPFKHRGIDWQVDSSQNKLCWPRWFMACMANTEYVCTIDDDLFFRDYNLLQDFLKIRVNLPDRTILGIEGVN